MDGWSSLLTPLTNKNVKKKIVKKKSVNNDERERNEKKRKLKKAGEVQEFLFSLRTHVFKNV